MARSKNRKKRKKHIQNTGSDFSETSFLKKQARHLPLETCYITEEWESAKKAVVAVTRKHTNGNLSGAFFIVDLLCEGIRDAFFIFNESSETVKKVLIQDGEFEFQECEYELVHNIIWGAVEFAAGIGLKPYKDFARIKYMLAEDNDEIEFIDIDFGMNGRPVVLLEEDNNQYSLINRLNKTIGKDNFDIMSIEDYGDIFDSEDYENIPEKSIFKKELQSMFGEKISEHKFDIFYDIMSMSEEDLTDEIFIKNLKKSEESAFDFIEIFYNSLKGGDETDEFTQQFLTETIPETQFDIEEKYLNFGNLQDISPYFDNPEFKKDYMEAEQYLAKDKWNILKYLERLLKKYPDNPVFLTLYFIKLSDTKKFKKYYFDIENAYNKFSDYLFLKIIYAQTLILENKTDEVPEVFNNQFNLQKLYPERSVFHITELFALYGFLVKYNIEIGEIEIAEDFFNAIKKFEEKGDPLIIEDLYLNIIEAKTQYIEENIMEEDDL